LKALEEKKRMQEIDQLIMKEEQPPTPAEPSNSERDLLNKKKRSSKVIP
jgi:hypothetical protein